MHDAAVCATQYVMMIFYHLSTLMLDKLTAWELCLTALLHPVGKSGGAAML